MNAVGFANSLVCNTCQTSTKPSQILASQAQSAHEPEKGFAPMDSARKNLFWVYHLVFVYLDGVTIDGLADAGEAT